MVLDPFARTLAGLLLATGSVGCLLVALVQDEPMEADVVVNRTVVYGLLTMLILAMYGLVVGYLGGLFRGDDQWVSLAATGIVAIAFQPLRERVQRRVNRMMYGQRDEPYALLTRLGRELESAVDPAAALDKAVGAVASALRLPYVAILLQRGDGLEAVAVHGEPRDELTRLPLMDGGAPIGELVAAPRAPDTALTAADVHVLRVLASHLGATAQALRLTRALDAARLRIVAERAEERRRLGADLHDDVGHRLVALSRQVERAMAGLPAGSREPLAAVGAQLAAVTARVRGLAHQQFPPDLDVLGLAGALRERAAACPDPRVLVDAPEALPRLPAAVEVAAYHVALEAMANAARHAEARECRLRLRLTGPTNASAGVLELDVVDDGRGVDPARSGGLGLLSMRARAAELGGTCAVEAAAGGGTAVRLRIPIAEIME